MPTANVLQFIFGIAAAALWFWTSIVKIKFGGHGGVSSNDKRKLTLQHRLTAGAAILTGIATLAQGFSALNW